MTMFISLLLGVIILTATDMLFTDKKNIIELYVLIDKDKRITYTGSYQSCKSNLNKELKLIKLEGIL